VVALAEDLGDGLGDGAAVGVACNLVGVREHEEDRSGSFAGRDGVQPEKDLVQALHAAVAEDGPFVQHVGGQLI
jgi:hypothetical protein